MKRKMSLFAMMGLMAIMSLFAQNVQGATIPLTVNAGGVVGGESININLTIKNHNEEKLFYLCHRFNRFFSYGLC